jgi:hypothetical protein
MGKVISITWVTREDQLPKLMSGTHSILTGANLVNLEEVPKKEDHHGSL